MADENEVQCHCCGYCELRGSVGICHRGKEGVIWNTLTFRVCDGFEKRTIRWGVIP